MGSIVTVLSLFSYVLVAFISSVRSKQHPIQPNSRTARLDLPYTRVEQNDDLCDAGSRQWTGLVNVTEDRSLFYWFFESKNDPKNDPLMIWLNGGPGGSSMVGLMHELGPCLANGTSTIRNQFSWTERANILFVDQPAGVGLSPATNMSAVPIILEEAAVDFTNFLTTFFHNIFPDFSSLPVHFAGESFGGHYLPVFTKNIIERQRANPLDTPPFTLKSLILANAQFDIPQLFVGIYDQFCSEEDRDNDFGTGFNDTACNSIIAAIPECERLGRICTDASDITLCMAAIEYCYANIASWFYKDVVPGGRDPANRHHICDHPPICGSIGLEIVSEYINQPHVLKRLGFSNYSFIPVNMEINRMWWEEGNAGLATTKQLSWILDETDLRVLILNGNDDVIVNTPGQIHVLDNLPWKKQAQFRIAEWDDWNFPTPEGKLENGGKYKFVDKLWFITVDGGGHTFPADQRERSLYLANNWLTKP